MQTPAIPAEGKSPVAEALGTRWAGKPPPLVPQAPFLSPQGTLLSHKGTKSLYQAGICTGNRGLGSQGQKALGTTEPSVFIGCRRSRAGMVERAWGASSHRAQD